jgi:hypothetical protein
MQLAKTKEWAEKDVFANPVPRLVDVANPSIEYLTS